MDILGTILSIILTSLLTAGLLFLSLRYIFGTLMGSISGLTNLGAKMAGIQSGSVRAAKAVRNDAAEQILSSPNLAGIKMAASQFGFDIEGMIEDHGAEETLMGLTQLLQMLGINPMDLLSQGLGGLSKNLLGGKQQASSGGNPYK